MNAVFSVDVEKDLHTDAVRGISSLIILSNLLKKYQIFATFFVTGEILEKYPKLFKELSKEGHEIALHGYSHRRFDIMSNKEKEAEINKMVKVYKKIFKCLPIGFRAPQHSIDSRTIDLLEKYGFKYDSSKTPFNLLILRHINNSLSVVNNFLSYPCPHKIRDSRMFEIPRTAFLFSTGGFELKIYPSFFYKFLILILDKMNIPFVFVMHSWDMINIPSRTNKLCNKDKFLNRLDSFLAYSSKKLNYVTMRSLYENTRID
jgi:hypothetical protein